MTTKKNTKKQGAESTPAEVNEIELENLAVLIAGVLSHPACPPEIYDHLIYGINECVSSATVNHHPGYLKAILIENAKGGK
jgi:hypothetical protein